MAYYADVWSKMRGYAIEYLLDIKRNHPGNKLVSTELLTLYEGIYANLLELTILFPMDRSRHELDSFLRDEKRVSRAVHLLELSMQLEQRALTEMKNKLRSL